jgi:hypothetical protein
MNPGTPAAGAKGTVRVTLPAAVAYDLKALQKSIASLVERLGCRTCFSGADCTFRVERDLVINERLEAVPLARVAAPDPDGDPARAVSVHLAKEVRSDLTKVHAAVERVVGKLGCPACCSGFDIAFREEFRFLTVNKDLDVQAHGPTF